MKDENRKFLHCIFCQAKLTNGKNGTRSREHIFGKVIADKLEVTDHWSANSHHFDSSMRPFFNHPKKVGGSPLTYMTSRSTCRKCNSGTLGTQLNAAREDVLALFSGYWLSISHEQQIAIFHYFSRIAALVDAETSNLDLKFNSKELSDYSRQYGALRLNPPVLTSKDRALIVSDKQPLAIRVNIGKHTGFLGKTLEFNVCDGGIYQDRRAKKICFSIQKLSIILEIGNWSKNVPNSFITIPATSSIKWPPPNLVTYDDFYSFYAQTPSIVWMRKCLRNKMTRRNIEKRFKKTGEIVYPHPGRVQ